MAQKCLSCRVQFASSPDHRAHFQSEWHCYNLKRKIATLPPLTKDEFDERKVLASAQEKQKKNGHKGQKTQKKEKKRKERGQGDDIETADETEPKWMPGDNPRYRWLCERARQMGLEDDEWEEMSEEGEDARNDDAMEEDERIPEISAAECVLDGKNQRDIPLTECFFSGHMSDTIDANLEYMEKTFGFFIPCQENLVDRDGLLAYVARKIGVGNVCPMCNESGKAFYSLTAVRQHMIGQSHCRLNMSGEKAFEYSDFYDFDDDSDSDDDEQDAASVGELVLKDGSVIGHRSLWKYFKQSFNPRTEIVLKAQSKRKQQINQYRAIGYYGTVQEAQYEKKQFKQAARWKKHHQLALGLKNNKTMMEHFKRRDGFCM